MNQLTGSLGAMVSPLEVVKRTAPVMACGLVVLYVIS